jgi:hypothetical protein
LFGGKVGLCDEVAVSFAGYVALCRVPFGNQLPRTASGFNGSL